MTQWPEKLYVASETDGEYLAEEFLTDLATTQGGKREVAVYRLSGVTRTRVAAKKASPTSADTAPKPVKPVPEIAPNVFGKGSVPAPPIEEPRPIPKKRR